MLHKLAKTVFLGIVACKLCLSVAMAAGLTKYWDIEPYRIHAILAIDAPGGLTEELVADLPPYIQRRTAATIGAVWRLQLDVASGVVRHQILDGMSTATESELLPAIENEDKQVWLSVRATPSGYQLAAREYDRYVQRWSETLRRECRQLDALPEQLFQLLCRVVAPLAQFHVDQKNVDQVVMTMRGSALPRRSDDFQWADKTEIFLPILRRTTREGELVENGIQTVPWTYIETVESDQESLPDGQLIGQVHSGTRRPLGVRRRGRIEQVAIAMRADPEPTELVLKSRTEPDKPLMGYEVFVQNPGEKKTCLAGKSDSQGEVRIAPGPKPIQMLYVRSGGELLGKLPVVAGVDDRLEVPLIDDEPRLRASARMSAMREDLVDLVARRSIYIARVRESLEEKDLSTAQQLLEALDELPGRARFNQQLARESRLYQADDEHVQRKIDQLFSATQTVLSQFLDPRPISELHDELRAARSEGS